MLLHLPATLILFNGLTFIKIRLQKYRINRISRLIITGRVNFIIRTLHQPRHRLYN